MHDLPTILLSYGVELKQRGEQYIAKCIAHDDRNPSMSVYINGTGKYTTHCFSCGFHEDAAGVVAHMEGIPIEDALRKLKDPTFDGASRYAQIIADKKPKRTERVTYPPPADAPMPKMGWLIDKDTGEPFGEPVAVYAYRTADGGVDYYEARFIVAGKKQPRCWSWGRRGAAPEKWECAFPIGIRTMYGLDQVVAAPESQIILCEGPRKAEAAKTFFAALPCIGYAGGCQSWKKTDWTPVAGRRIIMWPDADDKGRQSFAALAQHLVTLGCQVWILDTSDKAEGWDAADAIEEGYTPSMIMAWAKASKGEQIVAVEPEPEPTIAEDYEQHIAESITHPAGEEWTTEPADLFAEFIVPPLRDNMLPKVIEDFVKDRAYIINTDACFGALSCIVTAAGVIDDRIKIEVGHDWHESARLWGCIVGESSTKKSPMLMAVTKPLGALIEKVAKEDAEIGRKQDIIDARYKAQMKKYTEACIESDDHNLPMPPMVKREERHRVKVKSLTTEGMEEVLRDCPRGIFCDLDELAGWLGSMDAYRAAGAKKDRALWLEAYNGGPLQKDLVGRGSFLIQNWSVTIMGGIQPSKIRELAPNMSDDGLLQRFLVVCSEKPGGPARENETPNIAALKAWSDLIDTLYHTSPGGTLVKMTDEARAIRRKAVLEISGIINSGFISNSFTSALGKWEGASARLMLTYHCIDCASAGVHPESVPVSADTATRAMNYLMNHLLPHAVSFYEDGLGQSESQAICKLIADAIVAQGFTELTTRWLAQYGPNRWRIAGEDRQRQVLARLTELGWIQAANMAGSVTKRPTRYNVNPHVHELCAKHKSAALQRIDSQREIGKRIRAGSTQC